MYSIVFKIEGGEDVTVFAVGGTNVLELARSANVPIDAPCSGNGTCGKCRVKVQDGKVENKGTVHPSSSRHLSEKELSEGWRLACEITVCSDAVFFVPDSASSYIGKIATEVFKKQWDGYNTHEFRTTDEESASFAIAVDIGTTTVSALLVDNTTGDILAKAGTGNGQIRYGADVITRIIEQQKPGGIKKLQDAIIQSTLIPLIDNLCKSTGVYRKNINRLTIAANTTMNHLLLGVDANSIRIEPYEPAYLEFDVYNPANIGINLSDDAQMLIAPNIGSYVGGDITAGILGAGSSTGWQMYAFPGITSLTDGATTSEGSEDLSKMTLFIDLGTNGEIVFGNNEFLMACACSAGPAFEGGDISCGMRATTGAIEACSIDKVTLEPVLNVIGGAKPSGLCGSGLIDVVAELFRVGAIDGKGKFRTQEDSKTGGQVHCLAPVFHRIRHDEYGAGSYVLAFAADSATGGDITITETDLDNFIRAKGAIFSGVMSLIVPLGFTPADIDDVFIAGGIGSGINIRNAIRIGMLPDLPEEKYRYLGNTALDGAYAMLLPKESKQALEAVNNIARNMTYIDLSTQPGYMDEFIAACFLPHTDETMFPSLKI